MNQENTTQSFDIIIIGGGPSGLSAAIYTSRDRLSTLLVEKSLIGGMITETDRIDNYPGFPESISGTDLTTKMYEQARKYGMQDINAEVLSIDINNSQDFSVNTTDAVYTTKAIIICGGSDKQRLGIPGEKEFTGRGVSFCATCDAPFYRDKTVAVVGGGNSAIYEAMHLAKFAKKVYIIHRRRQLRATTLVQEYAKSEPKIEFILNTVVNTIHGTNFVEKLSLKNAESGQTFELELDGLFVSIGLNPNTHYLKNLLALDANGMIIVDSAMQTSVPGIFAAGDIRQYSIRQAIAAAGDGAIAAINVKKWMEKSL